MKSSDGLRRLVPYLRPHLGRFLTASVSMVFMAGFNGLAVWLLKPVVDQVFIQRDVDMLRQLLWLIPIVFFFKMSLGYLQTYLMSYIGQKVVQVMRRDLFRHLHELSMDFFWRKRSGEVLSRVTNDLGNLQSALQFTPLYLIRDSLTALVLIALLFVLDWKFAAIAATTLPVCVGVLYVLGKKMRRSSMRGQEIMGDIYHRFQESMQGMLVVKAFNYEEGAIRKFDRENDSFFDQTMRYLRATALSGPLMEFLGALILTFLIYYGGLQILSGRMTPGAFFTFLAAFFAAYNPVKNLARLNAELQRGLAAVERVFEVLGEKPTVLESPRPLPFTAPARAIEFRGVSFRYPDRDAWALRGLDLSIAGGELLAVVGQSGSGKTTLAHLLLRLFDPVGGAVTVDGRDLRDFSIKSLRRHIGLVTQDTILLHDTVMANVALGRPEASREEILAALKAADAEDFVSRLPEGTETLLGDRGVRLSGGQRQRIAIARAVLKNPSLLILDEATSNLDTASEQSVQKALEPLYKGRTVLVIAHRLSTVQGADRIAVLRQGELAELGTHRELLSKGGVYATLYALQDLGAAPSAVS